MLKKAVILIFTIMLCISFASCGGKTISIAFPFEVTDVTSIDMFYFINPMEAEKKVITQQEDIKSIYQLFERISLKDKETEPVAGGSVTSFRFHLSDSTTYEIIYSSIAVKAGRIHLTGNEKDYFTSADIGACWNNYDYEAVAVDESELPSYE